MAAGRSSRSIPTPCSCPSPTSSLAPLEPPEVWCAGVTYERSRDARVEESAAKDVYTLVYERRVRSSS